MIDLQNSINSGTKKESKHKNILLTNQFVFENSPCICVKDTENLSPSEAPRVTLKVAKADSPKIEFSYIPSRGLCQTGKAGKVYEGNLLGQILSIDDDIDAYISFFQRYGFLVPIRENGYESVESSLLIQAIQRIKSLVSVLNGLSGKTDFTSLLVNTSFLLFSSPYEIQMSSGNVSSYKYRFTKEIRTYNRFPDFSRDQEVFDTGKKTIPDTIYGEYKMDEQLLRNISAGLDNSILGSNDLHFKHLVAMYAGCHDGDTELRSIVDFYYHYQVNVGVISECDYRKINYYTTPAREHITDELRSALIKVAKIVVYKEINHNITNIHPRYNGGTLIPEWKIESLLQALYFSLFYMRTGLEIYKKCGNPRCKRERYFLVEATRSNKEYCCTACARTAASQRHRARLTQTVEEGAEDV